MFVLRNPPRLSAPRRPSRAALVAAGVSVAVVLALAGTGAAAGDVGYQGPSISGTSTPTGTKRAESVLWWNDGSWWAVMWDASHLDFHIFGLDGVTQRWVDTGVTVDGRANTHSDVLWDGTHLYVASHLFVDDGQSAVSGYPSYLFRFSYDAAARTYSLDTGFPVTINNMKTETLVIDKDSTGKLWATWMQNNQIYVNRTVGDDHTWGAPFALPAAGSAVTVDDNSAVVAFGGDKIGVMWSNQSSASDAMYFSVHVDGQPDTSWASSRTAIQGSGSADDHINLKSLQSDGSGRVYAAVKTSFTTSSAPLIMLLVRDAATGDWSSYPIARVADCPNRPLVLIDEENRVLHAFFTAPASPSYSCNSSGGAIYEKTSPLDSIAFPSGYGTVVIQDLDSPYVHNVTSTKQNVRAATGIVVLAANGRTGYYWHHYEALGSAVPTAPTAAFSGTPRTGEAPLSVAFTDLSLGVPTNWSWDFGDGSTSTLQNPTHTYGTPGTYAVTLTVSNAVGTDTKSEPAYIDVTAPTPDFSLAVSPPTAAVVRGFATTFTVSIAPVNGFSGPVDLAVTGLPVGATASFTPNPVGVPAETTATLSIATSSTTKQGAYGLTITGTSGSLTHTATVTLQIKRR